jgi:hypothetical protein
VPTLGLALKVEKILGTTAPESLVERCTWDEEKTKRAKRSYDRTKNVPKSPELRGKGLMSERKQNPRKRRNVRKDERY